MPADEALQYVILKKALLKRYKMTEERFRNKFRHAKPEQGDTTHQFVARLQRYFNRWVDMFGCVKEYKDFADLLIREQFVNTCSAEKEYQRTSVKWLNLQSSIWKLME